MNVCVVFGAGIGAMKISNCVFLGMLSVYYLTWNKLDKSKKCQLVCRIFRLSLNGILKLFDIESFDWSLNSLWQPRQIDIQLQFWKMEKHVFYYK